MARAATVDADGAVRVTVALTTAGCPLRAQLMREIVSRAEGLPGVTSVAIDWTEMTAEQKATAMGIARKNAQGSAGPNAVPHRRPRARRRLRQGRRRQVLHHRQPGRRPGPAGLRRRA